MTTHTFPHFAAFSQGCRLKRERPARQADPARGTSPGAYDDSVGAGRFLTAAGSEGVGNLRSQRRENISQDWRGRLVGDRKALPHVALTAPGGRLGRFVGVKRRECVGKAYRWRISRWRHALFFCWARMILINGVINAFYIYGLFCHLINLFVFG